MSSQLFGKVESTVDIKASPTQFHNMFKHKPDHISNVVSEKIQGCELHEGEWGTVGSVIYWKCFHYGKERVAKEIVEAIDDENDSITLRVIEGDALEHFKSFVITIQSKPKPDGIEGSVIHWTIEYERLHDEILDPHTLVEFAIELSKDLEAHLLRKISSSDKGKLEIDLEIKACPRKFQEIFRHKPHNISNVASEKIHAVELHDGEWGTVGSILCWKYFLDGKAQVVKDIVEAIDEEKNSITFRVLEGDLMEHYKSFRFIVQANPKPDGGEGSIVHWTLEYEKHHNEVVDPHTMFDFVVQLSKDLEAHLLEDN